QAEAAGGAAAAHGGAPAAASDRRRLRVPGGLQRQAAHRRHGGRSQHAGEHLQGQALLGALRARTAADARQRARGLGPGQQQSDRLPDHPDRPPRAVPGQPAHLQPVSARAGIVVTGTEVLAGRVRDRNGPWLADRLAELGIDLAHITICGDRPEDMEAQLRFLADQGVDLIVTSGGLGPTADDLTAEVVARFAGRPMQLDPAVEARIAEILKPLMRRWRNLDPDAVLAANRKQAMVPEGASVIDPAGTAPGLVVPPLNGARPTVVVLPGPPRELHEMWPQAVATEAFREAVTGAVDYEQHLLRLFG